MFSKETLDPRFTFQFQLRNGTRQESLIWRLYAPFEYVIDCLGCLQQNDKNEKKVAEGKNPGVRYQGHIDAFCGAIRAIQTDRNYRFELVHGPEEGIYHIHVSIIPPVGITLEHIEKTTLMELRDDLWRAFDALENHDCDESNFSICRLVTSRWIINTYACFAVLGLSLKQYLKTS